MRSLVILGLVIYVLGIWPTWWLCRRADLRRVAQGIPLVNGPASWLGLGLLWPVGVPFFLLGVLDDWNARVTKQLKDAAEAEHDRRRAAKQPQHPVQPGKHRLLRIMR
jgi:hypothetical protein